MGYFPNGDAGDWYEATYCSRCVHDKQSTMCPVMALHMQHNYEECNKPDSFLHFLIPRSGVENERCRMFVEAKDV